MKLKELLKSILVNLKEILHDADLQILDEPEEDGLITPASNPDEVDCILSVLTKCNERFMIPIEVKLNAQPRFAKMSVSKLFLLSVDKRNVYGILGATYISPRSAEICKRANIGYIDLSGNCYVKFGGIYIHLQGNSNKFSEKRELKTFSSRKTLRALKILLKGAREPWYVKNLALTAEISLGQSSNIKKKLLDNELAHEVKTINGRAFKIREPDAILNILEGSYDFHKNTLVNYYSFDKPDEIEIKMTRYCAEKMIPYAFTLTSGSRRISPMLRYTRVFAYMKEIPESFESEMKVKKTDTGANLTVILPYDEGILADTQNIRGETVVSDLHLYLDLMGYKGRGREAAQALLKGSRKNGKKV